MTKGYKTGGRVKGTPNKSTAELKAIAQAYGPASIKKLAQMAGLAPGKKAESEAVQVAAHQVLLERGYGKATQQVDVRRIGSFADLQDDELAALARGGDHLEDDRTTH